MKLTVDQRDDFAKLVVISRLADRRRALCLRMGLNPYTLDFVKNRVSLDFAIELIADCEEKELDDALIRLLAMVTEELRDNKKHHAKIAELHKVLDREVLSPESILNEPSVLVDEQDSTSNGNDNVMHYTDTHIMSVLQIWSPMVIVWMFLLLLAPNRYEKYINQFRASTARNINISLGCLLTYLPLLILALRADRKYTLISNSGLNWHGIVWLAVIIAWLVTMVIGRFDRDEIGDFIGILIGILVGIIVGAIIPTVFGPSLGILSTVCIGFTGGTAYTLALFTINDRNVVGAGIGAAVTAVLTGAILMIFLGQILSGILVILTVVGAMAVFAGVTSGLLENLFGHRTSKRGVFTLVVFIVCLVTLFSVFS